MMGKTVQSVEPNIADLANGWMKSYGPDYKLEQESLNTEIDRALDDYYDVRVERPTVGAPNPNWQFCDPQNMRK